MAVHPDALKLITDFEGFARLMPDGRVKPYLDAVGVATIGYGSTSYADGKRVTMSDAPMTRVAATGLFEHELAKRYEAAVDRLTSVPLHPLSRGALISFAYNCGTGAYRGSGLRKAVNERRWDDAVREFAKWRMAGGRVLPGLVRRRAAEAAMFRRGCGAATETVSPAPTSRPPEPTPQPPRAPSIWRQAFRHIFGRAEALPPPPRTQLHRASWQDVLSRVDAPAPLRTAA